MVIVAAAPGQSLRERACRTRVHVVQTSKQRASTAGRAGNNSHACISPWVRSGSGSLTHPTCTYSRLVQATRSCPNGPWPAVPARTDLASTKTTPSRSWRQNPPHLGRVLDSRVHLSSNTPTRTKVAIRAASSTGRPCGCGLKHPRKTRCPSKQNTQVPDQASSQADRLVMT